MTAPSALAALLPRPSLAIAASMALTLPALAQGTVAWSDTIEPPNLSFTLESLLYAHPAGGATQVLSRGFAPGSRVVVRRVDEAGDQTWSTDFAMPAGSNVDTTDLEEALVTSRGSTVTVHWAQFTNETVVTSIDTNGSLEWQTMLSSNIPNHDLRPLSMGTTPTGDVLLAGIETANLPSGTETTGVRALDGATGVIRWTYALPTRGNRNTDAATFRDGRTYLAVLEAGGLRIDCLDANGSTVYSTPAAEPFFAIDMIFASATSGGDLIFGTWRPGSAAGTFIVRLDSSGNVAWRTIEAPRSITHYTGTLTSDDQIALLDIGSNDDSRVTLLDGSGQLLWHFDRPATLHRYRGITADAQGGLIVTAADFGSFSPESPAFEFIDANGTSNGILTFPSPGVGPSHYRLPSVDALGNAWVGFLREPSQEAIAVKLAIGDPNASAVCTPTALNSTGAISRLRAAGSGATAAGNLTLVVDQLPASQFVLFLSARSQGLTPNPGGSDGTLCLGGSIGRFIGPGQVRMTNGAGLAALPLDLSNIPNGPGTVAVGPGDTWYFQAWHRDFVAGSATSNLTGAVSVTFL